MLLNELFEQSGKTAAVTFGRLNPPTSGHQKLVDAVSKQKADAHFLFVSQTQKTSGKNQTRLSNPIPFDTKLEFVKKAFPSIDIGDTSVSTAIGMLQYLEKQGFENVIFVGGSDRVEAFTELFNKQNGVDYNFKSIKIASSGARDPDAEGAEGMSASKMRAAAIADDIELFKTGLPAGLQGDAEEVFSAVRQGLEPWLEEKEVGEGWDDVKKFGKKAAVAGAIGLGALGGGGAYAQSSGEDYLPDIVAHVKFKVNGKEISKDINLGTQYKSPREAAEALEKFLRSKGIKYFEYDLERVKPKDDDYMDKTPYSKNNAVGEAISLKKLRAAGGPETPANRDLSDRLKQGMSSKPPNLVAKNASATIGGGGAGAHTNAKKTANDIRGQKHKAKQYEEGVAEGSMDDGAIWNRYGHYNAQDLIGEFPNLSPEDAQTIANFAEYGWTNGLNRQEYRDQVVQRVKAAMGQQGVEEAKSASRRWHDALQREKERRERNERAGQKLLNPKKKEEPKEKDVEEAAPPTAKGERMVKHIKKGYANDGKLTDKERSIAYATAWKAHNKS